MRQIMMYCFGNRVIQDRIKRSQHVFRAIMLPYTIIT